MPQTTPVLFGIDILLQQTETYAGKRIALVSNSASVTTAGIASRVALLQKNFTLVKLFSPEHGLNAVGEDGSFQHDAIDDLTGLPIISLYGDKLAPSAEDLIDIDVVVFDIPDVGSRFYTYLWTMTHVMDSCAANDIILIIADRPNPIGGDLSVAEGPMLDETNCSSFIGRYNIPVRHSCTLGELAQYFVATRMNNLQLKIMSVQHWDRLSTTGFIFTPTSPAIQQQSTALLYPGMGLLEGININEGRGTNQPFHCCGAPWMNAEKLATAFAEKNGAGFITLAISYTPETGLYAGEICNGLQFFVTDNSIFKPVQTGIALLQTICSLYPAQVKERLYTTVANPSGAAHLDKLLGLRLAFEKIMAQQAIDTNIAAEWQNTMQPYLLY
ncbi:MAG: DUF1343 domain-containing protein [Ferruginibacter sp.]